jgi:hypothetical protein
MARRRRRQRHDSGDTPDSEPPELVELEAHLSAEPLESTDDDRSCLIHPSHDLDLVCDECGVALCAMCSIPYGTSSVCAECLDRRVEVQIRASTWRGWVALAAGLFGIANVLAPFTFAGTDPSIAAAFPGGTMFFNYASMASGAAALAAGLIAQDFEGLAKRAGLVGAGLGALVLAAVVALNLAAVLLR